MKYQFCIRFNNIDANSAASKAVLDCNRLFKDAGYKDFTITVGDNSKKFSYYFLLLKELVRFFLAIKKNSLIGIQYPLLSINNVFGRFMNAARKKSGVRFFCIVHDLESLRTGGDSEAIQQEVERLNKYDYLIVHNEQMRNWLLDAGVTRTMLTLEVFDYLVPASAGSKLIAYDRPIVYAGNLTKSVFVTKLKTLTKQEFNLYGPGGSSHLENTGNVHWVGQYTPEDIASKLTGSFGLIWDGEHLDRCDEVLGNYLKFNNPHKFSLYLAAGLPVIAPRTAAISGFIQKHNLGVLIDNLFDLQHLAIDESTYFQMCANVKQVRAAIINGYYFKTALAKIEQLNEHRQ